MLILLSIRIKYELYLSSMINLILYITKNKQIKDGKQNVFLIVFRTLSGTVIARYSDYNTTNPGIGLPYFEVLFQANPAIGLAYFEVLITTNLAIGLSGLYRLHPQNHHFGSEVYDSKLAPFSAVATAIANPVSRVSRNCSDSGDLGDVKTLGLKLGVVSGLPNPAVHVYPTGSMFPGIESYSISNTGSLHTYRLETTAEASGHYITLFEGSEHSEKESFNYQFIDNFFKRFEDTRKGSLKRHILHHVNCFYEGIFGYAVVANSPRRRMRNSIFYSSCWSHTIPLVVTYEPLFQPLHILKNNYCTENNDSDNSLFSYKSWKYLCFKGSETKDTNSKTDDDQESESGNVFDFQATDNDKTLYNRLFDYSYDDKTPGDYKPPETEIQHNNIHAINSNLSEKHIGDNYYDILWSPGIELPPNNVPVWPESSNVNERV